MRKAFIIGLIFFLTSSAGVSQVDCLGARTIYVSKLNREDPDLLSNLIDTTFSDIVKNSLVIVVDTSILSNLNKYKDNLKCIKSLNILIQYPSVKNISNLIEPFTNVEDIGFELMTHSLEEIDDIILMPNRLVKILEAPYSLFKSILADPKKPSIQKAIIVVDAKSPFELKLIYNRDFTDVSIVGDEISFLLDTFSLTGYSTPIFSDLHISAHKKITLSRNLQELSLAHRIYLFCNKIDFVNVPLLIKGHSALEFIRIDANVDTTNIPNFRPELLDKLEEIELLGSSSLLFNKSFLQSKKLRLVNLDVNWIKSLDYIPREMLSGGRFSIKLIDHPIEGRRRKY
jgi:hypothetical protein